MLLSVIFPFFSLFLFSEEIVWEEVQKGLDYAEIDAPQKSEIGDSKIRVLRVDMKNFNLKLISAKESKTEAKPVSEWAKDFDFFGAINAGMFKTDYRTHVGYMKNFKHINNPKFRGNYGAFIVFNPKKIYKKTIPPVWIVETDFPKSEPLLKKYESAIQVMRLYDSEGNILWKQKDKRWSQAIFGVDKSGRALFIVARSPYSVYDFAAMLKAMPIELVNGVYLDGGPCTTLFVRKKDGDLMISGSFETGFNENDDNMELKKIPNIISVVRKNK